MLTLESFHRPHLCFGDESSKNSNEHSQNNDSINGKKYGKELPWYRGRLLVPISTSSTDSCCGCGGNCENKQKSKRDGSTVVYLQGCNSKVETINDRPSFQNEGICHHRNGHVYDEIEDAVEYNGSVFYRTKGSRQTGKLLLLLLLLCCR